MPARGRHSPWEEREEGPEVGRPPEHVCQPRPSQSLGGEGGRQGRHRGGTKAEWAGPRRAGEGLAPGKGGGAGSAPPPGGNAPPIA